jgi:hypothetical protein
MSLKWIISFELQCDKYVFKYKNSSINIPELSATRQSQVFTTMFVHQG